MAARGRTRLFPVARGSTWHLPTLCSRTASSTEQLSLAGLPWTPSHMLLSFCYRSKSQNPYKDSPASNSGQERPGDLFMESPLTGAEKNKVTWSDTGLVVCDRASPLTSSAVAGQGPGGGGPWCQQSKRYVSSPLGRASMPTSSFPCFLFQSSGSGDLIEPFCIFLFSFAKLAVRKYHPSHFKVGKKRNVTGTPVD